MSKLFILCGLPGSGKSTYAKKLISECNFDIIYLSSDAIREEIYGDASIQGNPEDVFKIMHSRASEALKKGVSIIYDATNINRKNRKSIIDIGKRYDSYIACHIVWAPIDECIRRDSERTRNVGTDVIMKMAKRFEAPFFDEGINFIKVIFPDDFDADSYTSICELEMNIPHDNPNHSLNILDHCKEAFKYLNSKSSAKYKVAYAAKWHDLGKPMTKSFINSKGQITPIAHYYNHDNVGAWMSYGIKNMSLYSTWMISNHMQPFFNSKYYNKLSDELKSDIDLLHEADIEAH